MSRQLNCSCSLQEGAEVHRRLRRGEGPSILEHIDINLYTQIMTLKAVASVSPCCITDTVILVRASAPLCDQ